ncbi:MAG: serine/threonine-protein kinase, partial [Longimicrobiales bacterium]|nr:serine/threonine-protein kinase [Longimicrobiales bacterium]
THHRPSDWRRVDELFDALLDAPVAERAARLRQLAGDDRGLVERVARLLTVEAELEGFLEHDPPALPTELASALAPPGPGGPALDPGERVGRYRIAGVLGRGGTSTVYLAERADGTFEQQVALKLLHPQHSGDDLAHRLRTEQQILATLSHPNLAKVFDGGVTGDGRPYLVVELVEGLPLTRHADERGLTVAERLRLFVQVARAVQYAHRSLVVHRDLKPSNILVTADGHVKLLDFGVAKLIDPHGEPPDDQATVTRWMTPRYAAPEQILGQPATTATDVHALGVILYELLSGRHPYAVDSESRFGVERAICESDPVPPSATARSEGGEAAAGLRGQDPAGLARTLGGDLDAVVLKALRKEPDARYGSAEAMAADVVRFLEGFPVEARDGATAYRARKFIRRHRAATVGAVAFVALLASGVASLTVQQAATVRERDRASAAAATAEREAANAQATLDFLADVFRGRNPGQGPNDTITALELVEWARERAPVELQDRPEVRAQLLLVLGSAYDNLGHPERAQEVMRAAIDLRREVYGPTSEEVEEALRHLSASFRLARDFESALAPQVEAVEILRRRDPPRDACLAGALLALGSIYRDLGDLDTAGVHVREALEVMAAAPERDEATYVSALLTLAYLRRATGDLDRAEALYREGIPRLRALQGDGGQDLPTALNNLAYLLRVKDDYVGADSLYREALVRATERWGRGHPSVAVVANNLGGVLSLQGRVAAADSLSVATLVAVRNHWQRDDWRVGQAAASLGRLRLLVGWTAEAEDPLREAVGIYTRELGREHEWTRITEAELGVQRILAGRPEEGRRALERCLALMVDWARSENGISQAGLLRVSSMIYLLEEVRLEDDAARFRALLPEDWDGL